MASPGKANLNFKKFSADSDCRSFETTQCGIDGEFNWLRNMRHEDLTIKDSEIAKALFEDWKAFRTDPSLQQRVLELLGQCEGQIDSLEEIFLKYQKLFMCGNSSTDISEEANLVESDAKLLHFQQVFEAMTHSYKLVLHSLDNDAFFNGDNALRENLLKDMEHFYVKLDHQAIDKDIEDFINLKNIVTQNDRESQLKSMVQFFEPARIRIEIFGKLDRRPYRKEFYILSWMRILYMSLQAADELRKTRISTGKVTVCASHKDEASIQITTKNSGRSKIMQLLKNALSVQIGRYKRGKCLPHDPSFITAFEELLKAGLSALKIQDCSVCDLDHLKKCFARISLKQKSELESDQETEDTNLKYPPPVTDFRDPDVRFLQGDEYRKTVCKHFSKTRIKSTIRYLFSTIKKDAPSFATKLDDDNAVFLSKSTLRDIQRWILTKASYQNLMKFQNILSAAYALRMETAGLESDIFAPGFLWARKHMNLKRRLPGPTEILLNGLTFDETVAAMLEHFNLMWDPGFSPWLRRKHANLFRYHRNAIRQMNEADSLCAILNRLALHLPSMASKETVDLFANLLNYGIPLNGDEDADWMRLRLKAVLLQDKISRRDLEDILVYS
eukprot:Gregarina_sp_Poly_1__4466@NODE_2401_length_2178_cov_19_801516_g1528_i0_p1_GENE_NODE_2401_length_2178_cov_19_801516_g1528_i0NODE_2401_length_2178_cov_19_801516_g1528_i0_p1_ORF_typecomplete_len653_score92_41Stonin2_N/PF12016_8/0_015Stonin2_N/PF12016_8/5_2e03Surfac_Dtrimer/PF09006_11/0_064D5_N/PF08706_11/0_84D5_N/PF08706_11/68_NODE_2401_length_2178_cov_19_801516_g1528_i01161960